MALNILAVSTEKTVLGYSFYLPILHIQELGEFKHTAYSYLHMFAAERNTALSYTSITSLEVASVQLYSICKTGTNLICNQLKNTTILQKTQQYEHL